MSFYGALPGGPGAASNRPLSGSDSTSSLAICIGAARGYTVVRTASDRPLTRPSKYGSAYAIHGATGTIARDHLYMRDPSGNGSVSNHKTAARIDIESKGFVIIANIGDQKSDLAGGHAEMTFKVPNPFYFLP